MESKLDFIWGLLSLSALFVILFVCGLAVSLGWHMGVQ